jgi:hypothetical protein
MARLLFVLGIVAVTFMIYSLVDTILRPANLVRALPKWLWIVLVLLIPVLGGVLWFLIGRGQRSRGGGRTLGPDDDPDFLGQLGREATTDEHIRDLERRLAEIDSEQPDRIRRPQPSGSDAAATGGNATRDNASGDSASGDSATGTTPRATGSSKQGEAKPPHTDGAADSQGDASGDRTDRSPGPSA